MAKKFGALEDKQRTVEWFADRIGHVTGSQRIGTYMTNLGNPHTLNRLLDELADELTWSPKQVEDQFILELLWLRSSESSKTNNAPSNGLPIASATSPGHSASAPT